MILNYFCHKIKHESMNFQIMGQRWCKIEKRKSQSFELHSFAILGGNPGGARTHDPMIKSTYKLHIEWSMGQRVMLFVVYVVKTFRKTTPVFKVNNSYLYTSLHYIIVERTVTSFIHQHRLYGGANFTA